LSRWRSASISLEMSSWVDWDRVSSSAICASISSIGRSNAIPPVGESFDLRVSSLNAGLPTVAFPTAEAARGAGDPRDRVGDGERVRNPAQRAARHDRPPVDARTTVGGAPASR